MQFSLFICSCSNTNICMPAGEIIFNDRPDLFDDPLLGSLKNCQDQNIVINLTMNVANYCCRFWKWVGCFIIGSENNGEMDRNASVIQWLCISERKYLPKKINHRWVPPAHQINQSQPRTQNCVFHLWIITYIS